MDTFGRQNQPEIKKEKVYWAHHCQSCHFEGSTALTNEKVNQKMDVYSCSNHTQPGLYSEDEEKKFDGDRIVVRYTPSSDGIVGEMAYDRKELDIELIKSRVQAGQGKSHYAPTQIAIGKVL